MTQMKPRREFPHPRPRVLYIGGPARGKSAPTRLRSSVFAAMAEAAYIG